ncbi:hypothetical protein Taro_049363 [Colocasia esculenta]|uniref:Glutathione S-transferase n=1 Tax=Colocasia esculenta TaxID=4460 RepID=A0A843XAS0_COLES|nr:hypothetical protein [Colocasia esculenta]
MAQEEELKLYGLWASPLCMTVEVALKLKGVNYEYIQEDFANKSEDLLRHNPMHRKVPVLVHKGKPLAETLIIAQYIDATWEEPPLLPEDPYERAMVCFWVDFLYSKLLPVSRTIFLSEGEKREKAIEEMAELIRRMSKELSDRVPLPNDKGLGLLDIAMGTSYFWLRALGEIAGVELVSEEKAPFMYSSLVKLESHAVAKEVLPERGTLVEHALSVREKMRASIAF